MVLPFRRVEADMAATYTLYGKLPNRADFVRVNANHSVVGEFDELIQRTLENLARDPAWTETYDTSRPVEFQYISRDSRHALMGMLAASTDQAGRRYPLLAAAILPTEAIASHAHIGPIAYEVFFDGLREQVCTAIENSVEALSCRQFLESQSWSTESTSADLELAQGVVNRFMRSASVDGLRKLLRRHSPELGLEQVLLNLAFYRAFLRRFENPATNQVIALPLPAEKGEQALMASAWLSVLKALGQGQRDRSPACGNYVLLQKTANEAALVACYASPQDKLVRIMLGEPQAFAAALDLRNEQEAWKGHRLYAEVSYALGRLLADPALSLFALCEFLTDVQQKLEEAIR
jgi:type VI secretion system protein ImpM